MCVFVGVDVWLFVPVLVAVDDDGDGDDDEAETLAGCLSGAKSMLHVHNAHVSCRRRGWNTTWLFAGNARKDCMRDIRDDPN